MRLKSPGRLLAALTLSAALAVPAAAHETIRIANIDSLSGATSSLGQDVQRGLQLAVEQINANGGVKSMGGAKIELVDYDTQSKVEVAQSQAEKAIAEGAVAIIGNSASAATLATTTVAERAGVPIMVSGASSIEITSRGYKYTFKINPNANQSAQDTGPQLQHFFKDAGIELKKLIHVHEDGPFGQSTQQLYTKIAPTLGFEIEELTFKTGSADLSGLISRLRRTDGQALIFTGYVPDGITFVTAMRQARVDFPFINVGISLSDKNFRAAVPANLLDGLVGYQYFNPAVKVPGNEDGPQKFYDAFQAKFNDVPGFISANAWTSMMTLYKALETAGSKDGAKIRDALAAVEFKGSDGHIMPNQMVKFDETGQNIYANIMAVQEVGDKINVIWPIEYAASKIQMTK